MAVRLLVLAAAAVAVAAMLSVLLFPLVGLRWARADARAVAAEPI